MSVHLCRVAATVVAACTVATCSAAASPVTISNSQVAVTVSVSGTGALSEVYSYAAPASPVSRPQWTPALTFSGLTFSPDATVTWQQPSHPSADAITVAGTAAFVSGRSAIITRTLMIPPGDAVTHVDVVQDAALQSGTPLPLGSLDAWYEVVASGGASWQAWSQSIKRPGQESDTIPHWQFKTPAVALATDAVVASLVANVSDPLFAGAEALTVHPPLLDVVNNAAGGGSPRLGIGAGNTALAFHSIYARTPETPITWAPGTGSAAVRLSHAVLLETPPQSGVTKDLDLAMWWAPIITRFVWRSFGRERVLATPDQQTNVFDSTLATFDAWRNATWLRDAQAVYLEFPCAGLGNVPSSPATTIKRSNSGATALRGPQLGGHDASPTSLPACSPTWTEGLDIPGGDLTHMQLETADPSVCQEACCASADPSIPEGKRCVAWALAVSQKVAIAPCDAGKPCCWLKSSVPTTSASDPNVVSGVPGCPWLPGTDQREGHDYKHMMLTAWSPRECMEACCGDPSCRSWVVDNSSTATGPTCEQGRPCCWLKHDVPGRTIPDAGAASGIVERDYGELSGSGTGAAGDSRDWDESTVVCGTMRSHRNVWADKSGTDNDGWFNAWFQNLRTALGMHIFATRPGVNNTLLAARSIRMVNLAVAAFDAAAYMGAADAGMSPSVAFLSADATASDWVWDSGWAGLCRVQPPDTPPPDCMQYFHVYDATWTAWWMLQWRDRLIGSHSRAAPTPADFELGASLLHHTQALGDLVVRLQNVSTGVVPAWVRPLVSPLEVSPFMRDDNAETASAALFLAELYHATGNATYLSAARAALDFVAQSTLASRHWWDFETFLSCSNKPFGFKDNITGQPPENNLAKITAAWAFVRAWEVTGGTDAALLAAGTRVLDYLLLTQTSFDHPLLSPNLIGGFTTQNTDAEWSDGRQGQAAAMLFRYYNATGNRDYLERAVGATRASFAVSPYENWAHTGGSQGDVHGALSSFHWGQGSGMATVEFACAAYGDAYVHAARGHAVGVNGCTLGDLAVTPSPMLATQVAFTVTTTYTWTSPLRVVVAGIENGHGTDDAAAGEQASALIDLVVNAKHVGAFSAAQLAAGVGVPAGIIN